MQERKPRVLVGMSGGVDSSVSAALLVEAGFDVCGAYMKNWTLDVPGMRCPWADDLAFAKRTAVRLGIDFHVYDFQDAYKREVVDYLVDEYKSGRTPNPDVMCNQEVKFGLFLESALEEGFDFIATGHYAKTDWWNMAYANDAAEVDCSNTPSMPCSPRDLVPASGGKLLKAVDVAKDQTYFLYRMSQKAVDHTLFPLGSFTKSQVRLMAQARGLPSADKPDSQGICFVGEAGIRDFLGMYVTPKPGETVDAQSGQVIGHHDGAIFFTIGQRKGLGIGGGTDPYFVVGKNMDKNIVYVSKDRLAAKAENGKVVIGRTSWISGQPPLPGACLVRVRHGGALIPAQMDYLGEDQVVFDFGAKQISVASGQSIVIYRENACLGGGIAIG